MKAISIRELQLNPKKALTELPVTLNRYGKPVAVITAYVQPSDKMLRKITPVVKELRNNVVQQAPRSKVKAIAPKYSQEDYCKHGSMPALCKFDTCH